jgi:hypothetical protein
VTVPVHRVSIVSSVPVSPRDFDYNAVDRTTIDAEAVGGLTSDQSSIIPGIHRLQVPVRPSPQEVGWLLDGSQIAALATTQPPDRA